MLLENEKVSIPSTEPPPTRTFVPVALMVSVEEGKAQASATLFPVARVYEEAAGAALVQIAVVGPADARVATKGVPTDEAINSETRSFLIEYKRMVKWRGQCV